MLHKPHPHKAAHAEEPKKHVQEKESESSVDHCVEEGCTEPKAPGQTYVCAKHVRTN